MKINPGTPIGGTLRKARLDHGIAQGDLARMIGVSIWVLNNVEYDRRPFDTDWIDSMPMELRLAVKGVLRREVDSIQVFRRRGDEVSTTEAAE
jgi:hypothetical protein